MKNRKSQVTDVTWRTATLSRRNQDKQSDCGGMHGGIEPKIVEGCEIEKANVGPSTNTFC